MGLSWQQGPLAPGHRIDIRQTSRHLLVRSQGRVVADSTRPLVLYESGFAPRWYGPDRDLTAGQAAGRHA